MPLETVVEQSVKTGSCAYNINICSVTFLLETGNKHQKPAKKKYC